MGNSYSGYWGAEGLSFNLTNLVSHREECFEVSKAVADIRPHGRISQTVPLIYCPLPQAAYLSQTRHPCLAVLRLRQLRPRILRLSSSCGGRELQFNKLLAIDIPHETFIFPIPVSFIAAKFAIVYEKKLLMYAGVFASSRHVWHIP